MMKIHTKKKLLLLFAVLIACAAFLAGCGKEKSITQTDQLNDPDVTVGVAAQTAEFRVVEENYPKAKIKYFKDEMSGYLAVSKEKIDAFVFNKTALRSAIYRGVKHVRILDESVGEPNISGVGFSPKTKIPDLENKVNEFLAEVKADGTLADMEDRWLVKLEDKMPDIPEPADPKEHLVVATSGTNTPFTYFAGTELAGYDVELAKRFAAWMDASIEFKVYDYDAIVAAAQSGDVDCIFANLFKTKERMEALRFSDPTYISDVGVLVRDDNPPAYTTLAQFNGKKIGACTGTIQGPAAEKKLPKSKVSYYENHADMLNALRKGKIDAYADSDIVVRYFMTEHEDLTYLKEDTLAEPVQIAAIFAKSDKGDQLREEFNDYLQEIIADGTMSKIDAVWYGKDQSKKKVKDASKLPATKGTLKMATDTAMPPVMYVSDNQVVGLDYDIAARFCEARGYRLEVEDMKFGAVVNAVAAGKCDLGMGGIAITPERAESVNFSDPMYKGNSVVAYLDKKGSGSGDSFLKDTKESFSKTFLREHRWKLFLSGIATTLLITVLSALFGTVLGFVVFMLCRKGNRVANAITRACVWLIQGMPVVVLLMILYYIVFGSADIPGTAVAVIGFTLIFAAAVYSMVKVGVNTVDAGQTEAAYSLGYADRRAFFRVVLPQALPHIMPAYKGQLVALIKATAIVGYVAVQDLTKMGDIVRSRTYEAFFPLIAVAIIYFLLGGLLTFIVKRIEVNIDPKHRTPEKILKGLDQA